MKIYCLEDFKVEYEKLASKKPYKTLEQETISYFFGKTIQQLSSGRRLNNSQTHPYIKKRLMGRGGFRFYFLLILKDENLYLMFVHPKTGPNGAENITDESKAYLYKKILDCIEQKDLFFVGLDDAQTKITFTRIEKEIKNPGEY